MWCCVLQTDFLEIIFYPQNVENRPSPGSFECIESSVFFSVHFSVCGLACPNYQCKKFAISLQQVKKEVSYAVDFLRTDKHESLLQIDTNKKHSQKSKFAMSLQYT